jgi:Lysylphosphatidylglycerol synthase TM region/O-Antigen ligase
MAAVRTMLRTGVATGAVSIALLGAVIASVFSLSTPAAFRDALSQILLSSVAMVVLCLIVGVLLAALRLKFITADLGYPISLRDAAMTLSVGQLVGNLFFQFAGQMISRAAYLAGRGIPPAASVIISGYERLFALFTSLALATFGAVYLFGKLSFDVDAGGLILIKLVLGLLAVGAGGAAVAWGPRVRVAVSGLTTRDVLHILRNGAISLAIQLSTLSAYVVAGRALAPNIDFVALAAASSLIMFAASLPISLGGWGMREMSAVVALKAVGLSSAAALVVGLLIGALSIAVVAITAAVLLLPPVRRAPAQAAAAPKPAIDWATVLDWAVPVAAASAVFFQIFVPTGTGKLNVNLADPLVLIGAALFALRHVGKGWPVWRIPAFNLSLAALTLVIGTAFLHGLFTLGWTEWAAANRLLGWPMLLCYLATGALVARHAHEDALQLLLAAFVASAAAVAALDVGILAMVQIGATSLTGMIDVRLTGFSQNPNAFAFILLLALAAALTLEGRLRGRVGLMTAILLGLLFCGSRAAYIAVLFIVAMAALAGIRLRPVAAALAWGAAATAVLLLLPSIGFGSGSAITALDLMAPGYVSSTSNLEHLATVREGLAMFMAHPLFGAGLGAFMAEQMRTTGIPLVIHSTPVWLLAETGLTGFAAFAYVGWRVFAREFSHRSETAGLLIVLVLTAFAVMGQAHDLLYQRALWLLLGAALAVPAAAQTVRGTGH